MSPLEPRDRTGEIRRGNAVAALEDRRSSSADLGRCWLGEAAGRRFLCEAACAFWETGGAVAPPGCLLDRVPIDLRREPEAARLLAVLKERLESSQSADDRRASHAQLSALVERTVHG